MAGSPTAARHTTAADDGALSLQTEAPGPVDAAPPTTGGATGAPAGAATAESECRHNPIPDPSLTRDQAADVADLFKVLGDPTRVLILRTLADAGELCVRHLAEAVGMSQSSVSHHLRLLRATALVRARRVGREVFYRPDDEHVVQLIEVCADHVTHTPSSAGR